MIKKEETTISGCLVGRSLYDQITEFESLITSNCALRQAREVSRLVQTKVSNHNPISEQEIDFILKCGNIANRNL